jgi:hypothetical protein
VRWSAVSIFLVLMCQRPLLAQDQDQDQNEQSTLRVSVNLVLLDATVKTKAGRMPRRASFRGCSGVGLE